MEFFSDFDLPKDTKIGITNLLSNITTKDHSHKGGWTKLLKCQLNNLGYNNVKIMDNKDSINHFEAIVFDFGAEYKGTLNLFGGLDEKCYKRVTELLEFHNRGNGLYSWQHLPPDLGSVIISRKTNKSTCDEFKNYSDNDVDKVINMVNSIAKFDHVKFKPHLLIGDSHTPSVWTPDMLIERQDGRTLHGMINKNTITETIQKFENASIANQKNYDFNEITVYAGNIDIRHHLMRQESPWDAAIQLVSYLEARLKQEAVKCKINVVQMLPIEDESRKLPKTGYYKGAPFTGSWNERSALHEIINGEIERMCLRNGWQVYKHPKAFYNNIGQLPFDVMEKPKSVHISPMHYRWDLENNKERYDGSRF